MIEELEICYSENHGWYVRNINGVLANGFASKEAAELKRYSIEITNQYIEKFKKGENENGWLQTKKYTARHYN